MLAKFRSRIVRNILVNFCFPYGHPKYSIHPEIVRKSILVWIVVLLKIHSENFVYYEFARSWSVAYLHSAIKEQYYFAQRDLICKL